MGGITTLRITIQDGMEFLTMKLEGRLAGANADEFSRTWHALALCLKQKRLHVDLSGVTNIDAEGKQILADIHHETGADFLADTPLAKYLAQEARRWTCTDGKEA